MSAWSPEVEQELLDRLANGESLSAICRAKHMPDRVTVWRRVNADAAFKAAFDSARQMGWLNRADEIYDFVRDEKHARSNEAVHHARLQFDAMRWLLSKALPKIYGDKLELSGTGPDGAIPIAAVVNVYRSSQPPAP